MSTPTIADLRLAKAILDKQDLQERIAKLEAVANHLRFCSECADTAGWPEWILLYVIEGGAELWHEAFPNWMCPHCNNTHWPHCSGFGNE